MVRDSRGPDESDRSTILVVDDDRPVLEVASKALERAGFRVLRGLGGEKALALADEHPDAIDLLLTDVVMPEMNGRELAERLRERLPDLPVLFMSAYTDDEVIIRGVQVAEVDFLAKPFNLKELVSAVESSLARRGAGGLPDGPGAGQPSDRSRARER